MLGTLFRVLVGFALACLAAGVAVVAYVITPMELANLAGDAFDNRLLDASALALRAATHAAIFAFALILAAISEWQALRSPVFYILRWYRDRRRWVPGPVLQRRRWPAYGFERLRHPRLSHGRSFEWPRLLDVFR